MAIMLGDGVITIKGDSTKLNKTFKDITKKAGIAFTAVGAAITGALGLAINSAVDFRGELAKVNTLGVQNLKALGDGIKDVTAAIGIDLAEATRQTYQIISAGVPEENAIEFLRRSAVAAKAGMGELGDAVNLGTSIMNAFGLEAKDVGTIFDVTQLAIKSGKTTIAELGNTVGRVAPTFAGLGLTFEEMLASITALTIGGIKTSEAISGMKQVFQNLLTPGKAASILTARLGLDFSASGLEANGFAGQMALIAEKTGGSAGQLKILFPAMEAFNVVLALAGNQSAIFTEVLSNMSNATGVSAEAFARLREGNPAQAFAELKAQVVVLAVEIGDVFLPVLDSLLGIFSPIIKGITTWTKEYPELTKVLVTVTGVVGLLSVALGVLLMLLPGIVAAFGLVTGGAGILAGGAGLAGVATAATGLIALLAGPLGLVAAIGVAVFAVTTAVKAFGGMTEAQDLAKDSTSRLTKMDEELKQALIARGIITEEAASKLTTHNEIMEVARNRQRATQESTEGLKASTEGLTAKTELTREAVDKMIASMVQGKVAADEDALALLDVAEASSRGEVSFDLFTGKAIMATEAVESNTMTQKELTKAIKDQGVAVEEDIRHLATLVEQGRATQEQLKLLEHVTGGVELAFKKLESPILEDIRHLKALKEQGRATEEQMRLLADTLRNMPSIPSTGGMAKGGVVGAYAKGQSVTTPLSLVGEQGPELVALPRGTRVFSKAETQSMMNQASSKQGGGGGGTIIENLTLLPNAVIRENVDMDRLMSEAADKLQVAIENRGGDTAGEF